MYVYEGDRFQYTNNEAVGCYWSRSHGSFTIAHLSIPGQGTTAVPAGKGKEVSWPSGQ